MSEGFSEPGVVGVCPICGSTGKSIVEVDDYTKVLYYFGDYKRMYAKKNVCTKCKYEW